MKRLIFIIDYTNICFNIYVESMLDLFSKDKIDIIVLSTDNCDYILDLAPDCVVLFRTLEASDKKPYLSKLKALIDILHNIGVPVTYFLDDLLMLIPNGGIMELLKCVNHIVVTTEGLKSYLESNEIKAKITIVPSPIPLAIFDAQQPKSYILNFNKYIVFFSSIAILGHTYLSEMFKLIDGNPEPFDDVLFILNSSNVGILRYVVNKYRNVNKLYFDFIDPKELYSIVKSSDLILYPYHIDDLKHVFENDDLSQKWIDSKTPQKYLLAGAGRLPLLTSHSAEYDRVIRHKENGIFCDTPEEFLEYILYFKNHRPEGKILGQKARYEVETTYDTPLVYPKIKSAFMQE